MSRRRFRWGVATSAFQIEGAAREEGKGESIWDRFVVERDLPNDGSFATDHYHRLEEDLDLLAGLGVNAYRFSVSWPRVIPDGTGDVNRAGLDFYDRLVDGLLERDIEPWLTLYHWDLPQVLQEAGGWTERGIVPAFARYAEVVAEHVGDRVGHFITHNEPWVTAYLGHLHGVFAPGLRSWRHALAAGHHLLLSHGVATEVIRNAAPGSAVGIALDCRPARPATDSAEDARAARMLDGFRNRWFFDPVFGRGYPEDVVQELTKRGHLESNNFAALVEDGDLDRIATEIDFLGVNYYTTLAVSAGAELEDEPEGPIGPGPPDGYTEMGWAIDSDGLRTFLRRVAGEYSPASLVITENGASYSDGPDAEGRIADERRIQYLSQHIDVVQRLRAEGVPVDGYFLWSLLDNVEWAQGFNQRFGLVWVDEESGDRMPKQSYAWYRDRIASS